MFSFLKATDENIVSFLKATDEKGRIRIRNPVYGYKHRVGRVLSFLFSRRNGTPPTPHPQASVPPLWYRGERHTSSLAGERGWERPNSNEGTCTVVLCINKYFVDTRIRIRLKMSRSQNTA